MTLFETEAAEYVLWLQVHNYADTTVACRVRYLAYFVEFCQGQGVEEPCDVSFELLQAYQQRLFEHRTRAGRPLAIATQAQRLVPVTHFFTWLRRSGRITVSPASDLLMPKPDRRLPEATLSSTEMSLLLAAPDLSRPLGLRDRAVLEVFYSCALRRAELIDVTVGDVDFDRGTVFVRNGKGAKDRYVPIGERALFWLRLYLELVRPQYAPEHAQQLFLSSVGKPLCPDWLSRRIRGYLAAAGIQKKGSCHLLRHTVATLMLEGGADIRYVAEMLGHARLETTQRYTRVSIDRLRLVHANTHPAAGFNVAMASELCTALPWATVALIQG
ncbi:MAG TPA: tyrosine-type recombinase/integrase [Gaiellaceae bacterium]|jgi:integrase/recombinase XerD|nr:tyrosine-type recombinase/integrase [Gaiellaceae bacterium]